jgi:hypothetical protein
LQFEASLGKQFARSYLKKPFKKKKATGGVAQGKGLSLSPSSKQKKKTPESQLLPS